MGPNLRLNAALVKIDGRHVQETLDRLESVWSETVPGLPFEVKFLDEEIDGVYQQQVQWIQITTYAASIAVLTACIGILGLASLSALRRTKEFGVRKALGATAVHVYALMSTEFLKLLVAANLIAWPVSFYLVRDWLNRFAYRIDVGVMPFLVSMLVTFVLVLAAISYQAYRAGRTDPVVALRAE